MNHHINIGKIQAFTATPPGTHLFQQKLVCGESPEIHQNRISKKDESTYLIFEHRRLSSSNNRFVQDGFPFGDTFSSFLWKIVDSNAYRVVNAGLLSSAYQRPASNHIRIQSIHLFSSLANQIKRKTTKVNNSKNGYLWTIQDIIHRHKVASLWSSVASWAIWFPYIY